MIRLLALFLMAAVTASAEPRPTFEPEIGARVTLDRVFRDSTGSAANLGRIMGGNPALLILGYDKCPNLCGVTQQAVAAELKKTDLAPDSYKALFVSIDPDETPEDALRARNSVAQATDEAGLSAWRFLTSADGAGARLASEVGMTFEPRGRIGQFVHPIAIFALTPDGRIARVLPATTFTARDLKLALVEASQGQLGSVAERVFLLCAGFDDSRGQYTPVVWAALKVGGIATLAVLGVALLALSRRRRP